MKKPLLTRRQVLRGLGGIAVGLPLLNLPSRSVHAEFPGSLTPEGYPKRFIVVYHPNGVIQNAWWPTGTSETNFTLSEVHRSLMPFQSKLIFPAGLGLGPLQAGPGEPHQRGMGGLLTGRPLQEGDFIGNDGQLAGWGNGISVDQRIAQHIGTTTALASLELGVRADHVLGSDVSTRLCYTGPSSPLPPINDPRQTFLALFGDSNQEISDLELEQLRKRRASVLDVVKSQFNHVRARAGRDDRQRLDAHAEMVRDIERRLGNNNLFEGTCLNTEPPPELDPENENTMPQLTKLQIDMLVTALACDITRVGSLQISNSRNHLRWPWVNSGGAGHSLSHAGPSNTAARDERLARHTWVAEQMAYLLERLDSIQEGSGTMLDHTVVLWCNELAEGNTHSQITNMPFVLAGSAGGYFKTGRHVTYANKPHNDLLVSLLNAFGIEETKFGDERFCNGPLANIT